MSELIIVELCVLGYSFCLVIMEKEKVDFERVVLFLNDKYDEFCCKVLWVEFSKIIIMVVLELM